MFQNEIWHNAATKVCMCVFV